MSKEILADMKPGEMLFTQERVYIGLAKEAYQKLENFLPAVERVCFESLFGEGYRHLILDWPTSKFIAFYINEKEDSK